MLKQTEQSELPPGGSSAPGLLVSSIIFWPTFIAGLAADLWTKAAVFEWLGSKWPPVKVVIDGFFRLVIIQNPGAAWGIASGRRIPLVVISVVAVIVIFAIFFFWRPPSKLVIASLGLFAAGVCGNLYDRVFNDGKVRDFLDFYWRQYHWPAFNIADTLLTIAVGVLIIVTFLNPSQKPKD